MAFDTDKYKELIVHALEHCVSNDELRDIYNRWAEDVTGGPKLYEMSDFDDNEDWLKSESPTDIIDYVKDDFYGFDTSCDYYIKNDSGYESFDDVANNVDIDGIANSIVDGDLEIYDSEFDLEELKRQCRSKTYRPLMNCDELRKLLNNFSNRSLYVRGKAWRAGDFMWLNLSSYGVRDGVFTFSLGNMCMTAREWFEGYEFSINGVGSEYQPFGVEESEDDNA